MAEEKLMYSIIYQNRATKTSITLHHIVFQGGIYRGHLVQCSEQG